MVIRKANVHFVKILALSSCLLGAKSTALTGRYAASKRARRRAEHSHIGGPRALFVRRSPSGLAMVGSVIAQKRRETRSRE